MPCWIRSRRSILRPITPQVIGLEWSELFQLLLFAVIGLPLYLFLSSSKDIGVFEIVVTLSYLVWLSFSTRKKWDWVLWIIKIATVLAIGVTLAWENWEVLHSEQDSVSTTVRNLGLVIGGVIAILLAVWRSIVAERQAETAQQSLMNERYQKGAEMLGNEALAVRLGGIYALERLAVDHPEQYHLQVMELFCGFVRHPTRYQRIEFPPEGHEEEGHEEQDDRTLRADVQNVMRLIGSRSPTGISLEQRNEDFKLYLRDANLSHLQVRTAKLSGAWLTKANLSGADLPNAVLSSARLRQANLSGAKLRHAVLSDAKFWGANLSKAILCDANLSGADLCGIDAHSPAYAEPVRGLTQVQLDEACADPGNPPNLAGVLDAETGEPLVWRGKPC